MVRTIQTTRVNTNYIPPPRQTSVYPMLVEEVPVDLHQLCVENGVILQDNLEEILVMPTPLSESQAFAAGASSSAPPAPAAQASTPGGDDPNDSGDGGEDANEEEEEENNNEEVNDESGDNFVGIWPVTEHYPSMFETRHFPNLLQ
jgi:ribosomal protein L12E/L44/L45/RPP1/RPP2